MRIAILHYHLRAGGVSRIIDLAVKALLESGHEVAVIAGSLPHQKSLLAPQCVGLVLGLNYSSHCSDIGELGREIDALARSMLGGAPDIWHLHNPTLGKNPALSMLAGRWADEGRAMVFQLHDFAEQGRPTNYRALREAAASVGVTLGEFLYPMHPRVRYAVLTSADAALLAAAGLKPGAVVLPNPVQTLPMEAPFQASVIGAQEYLVYPTRAIARKNLGEVLLWSSVMKPGQKLVVTMAPEEPSSRAEHDLWEEFAKRHDLPVVFDSVTRFGRPLGDFIAGSRAAITTSIREGFGMAYLEPWLLNTAVVGRDLPKVTSDFRLKGLSFDWLYPSIPVSLLAKERREHLLITRKTEIENALAYGINPDEEVSLLDGDAYKEIVDFGHLPSILQRRVLERCLSESFFPVSAADLHIDLAVSHTSSMNQSLTENFGLESYVRRLEKLYSSTLSVDENLAQESTYLDPMAVLAEFLKIR